MARQAVRVRGLAELRRAMARFPDAVDRGMDPVRQRAAEATANRARASVPRRSGALAGSIDAAEGTASMGAGLAYGGWIEYGGSRGRPYVAEGRYLGAGAQDATGAYEADAARQTQATIERFPWPKAPLL